MTEYPDQWHATVAPQQRADKVRFLSLLQVRFVGDQSPMDYATLESPGRVKFGLWLIEASLKPGEKASLAITDASGKKILAVDENGRPP